MGYTHYYYVSSYYKQEAWDSLLKDVKKLLVLPIPKVCAVGDKPPYEYENFDINNLGDLINSDKRSREDGQYNIAEEYIDSNGNGQYDGMSEYYEDCGLDNICCDSSYVRGFISQR